MIDNPTGMEGESSDTDDMQTGVDGDVSLAFGVRASDVQKVSGMGGMNSFNYGNSTGTKAADKSKNSSVNSAAIHQAGLNSLDGLNDPDNGYDENGNKINNLGGNKTDYILRKNPFGGDSYQILDQTDVKITFSPYQNSEGYGYRNFHKFDSPAVYDPSFDIISTFAGSGGTIKSLGSFSYKFLRGSGGKINGFSIGTRAGYGAQPRLDFHKLSNTMNSRATSSITLPKFLDGKKVFHYHRGQGNNLKYHRPWEVGPDGRRRW